MTTTRGVLGLLVGAVAVVALGAVSTTASADARSLARLLHEQELYLLSAINIGLFALVLGVRSFTDEFRHGTIAWTALAIPHRWRIVVAKSLVAAGAAAAIAAIAQGVMVGLALSVARARGASIGLGASDFAAALGLLVAAAAWAALGTAAGALVRHQVAAVVGAVVWVYVVENLAVGFLGDAGRFLPGQAAHAVAGADAAADLLSAPAGFVVLVVYVVALGAAAMVSISRRELLLAD